MSSAESAHSVVSVKDCFVNLWNVKFDIYCLLYPDYIGHIEKQGHILRGLWGVDSLFDTEFHFHGKFLDKFCKFGIPLSLYLILLNKSILVHVNVCKITG